MSSVPCSAVSRTKAREYLSSRSRYLCLEASSAKGRGMTLRQAVAQAESRRGACRTVTGRVDAGALLLLFWGEQRAPKGRALPAASAVASSASALGKGLAQRRFLPHRR